MRSLLTAALIPAAASAYVFSTARTPVGLRATAPTMKVESWYDQGFRLSEEIEGRVVQLEAGTEPDATPAAYKPTDREIANEMRAMSRLKGFAVYESPEDKRARAIQRIVDKQPEPGQGRVVQLEVGTESDATPAAYKPTDREIANEMRAMSRLKGFAVYESPEDKRARAIQRIVDKQPEPGQRREAYYCNEQGCWVAQQYFCNDTGCWIVDPTAVDERTSGGKSAKVPVSSGAVAVQENTIVQEGIFAPAVKLTADVVGRKELNAFRASVIAQHTKVIGAFVDTSESPFGQIALKALFEAACVTRPVTNRAPRSPISPLTAHRTEDSLVGARLLRSNRFSRRDKDGNGTLDKEEVKAALNDLGFTFINDKQVDTLFKKSDKDDNGAWLADRTRKHYGTRSPKGRVRSLVGRCHRFRGVCEGVAQSAPGEPRQACQVQWS